MSPSSPAATAASGAESRSDLAQAGAAVAVLARNEEKNRAVLDELAKFGVPARPSFRTRRPRAVWCPAGRFGTTDEMAGAAVFLASHASDFVTGSIVYVDGGFATR
jgi:Enoyl-(Acyl carrier protein) reductase